MNKVDIEETQVVGHIKYKYKVSYYFDDKCDYTILEALPFFIDQIVKGDENAR